MPDEIAAAGQKVVEMLGACAAAPDDLETGRAADEALMRLDHLLAAGSAETRDGAPPRPAIAGSSTAGTSLPPKGSSS